MTRFRPLLALAALLLFAAPCLAQSLDVGGWKLEQANSAQTYTIPAGTVVPAGGYLIVARDATAAAFATYYGVTLGSNVVFLNSAATFPFINGDETYTLRNAANGVEDGPTPALTNEVRAYHRLDPEASPWTVINTAPTPGSGVEAPDAVMSGLVISEANNPASYAYEYIELYYDGSTGTSNQHPVISSIQHAPVAPSDGDDVTITATVTDADGAVDVVWCWSRTGAGSFLPTVMTAQGGGQYAATFANQVGNTVLQYYVWARDDEGAESLNPANAPAGYFSVAIEGVVVGGKVVLFDHMHAQDAGSNGNWRVDDNHPNPLPATPTSETSWSGQLSSWGYELWLAGNTIRSNTSAITAAQLADVDLLVIPEPQAPFTAAEIEAVRQFVFAGGSLFVVADHNGSDRDGDGWDSPSIFGGYSVPHITVPPTNDTETFCGALFGLHFHVKDEGNNAITGTFANVNDDPANPVIHGPYGEVAAVIYHVGNVMSLWPTANPHLSDVGALISKNEGSPHVAAWSRYGQGKIVGYGDSSSTADGTDSESHENNWTEAGSDNREFFLNASAWLLASDATAVGELPLNPGLDLRVRPNPFNPQTSIAFTLPAEGPARVAVYDLQGRLVRTLHEGDLAAGPHALAWDGRNDGGRAAASGVYLVRAAGGGFVNITKAVLAR
ncbi:MAG: FlgD immunoglobulin-like domain containing protein [Candidatus Latescibacteria bacterium]|nr:FlgD immunoglobulin-like domain containing protein [Candidatus Latescibacterota bacterium]